MFDDIQDGGEPLHSVSLDARRPRRLTDIVGQQQIISRISQAAKSGFRARRYAFFGPTGSGKTTLAINTARTFFCVNSSTLGDACGQCKTCSMSDLATYQPFEEWTGARLEENWRWWEENGDTILERSNWCFFLDEAQDLSEIHLKAMFRQLEKANAMVIFATTHQHQINDALLGRFGTNVFDVRRPTTAQAVDCMHAHCKTLGVIAESRQLEIVAQHCQENLRLCVDFVYTAKDQLPDSILTDSFVVSVTGRDANNATSAPSRRVRL
jgi:DNA polymerase III gamma/tau subunit